MLSSLGRNPNRRGSAASHAVTIVRFGFDVLAPARGRRGSSISIYGYREYIEYDIKVRQEVEAGAACGSSEAGGACYQGTAAGQEGTAAGVMFAGVPTCISGTGNGRKR